MSSKMTDKELYNHFKTRSHTLDENPSDALWNSITNKMDSQPASKRKGFISLLVLGIIAIGVITYIVITKDINSLPLQKPKLPDQNTLTTDTVNNSTPHKEVVIEQITEDKTPTSINTPNTHVKHNTQKDTLYEPIVLKSCKTELIPQIKPDSIQGITFKTKLDSAKLSGIKIVTQQYKGRILIQVKEKITQTQFDSLVSASFKTYQQQYNSLLIVRAPGLKPYRERIAKYTTKPSTDTVKTEYIRFMPVQNRQLDTLIENESIIKTENHNLDIQPYNLDGFKAFVQDINEKIVFPENIPIGVYKVYTNFTVNTDGSVSDIKVIKKAGYGLDEAVIKAAVKIKEKLQPVVTGTIPEKLNFVIPITITIR